MIEQSIPEKQRGDDIKVKIAAFATGINAVLTGIKFLLYYFSGSMAILAEAWHSFADIATSLMVLIALIQAQKHKQLNESGQKQEKHVNDFELAISFCIGILLAAIACRLIITFFQAESRPVENSLVSGIIFLAFSLGSYFMYRFETQIGKKENSIGLVADGMHARADMTASLITGFALILYAIGINLDRWVGGLIALFVLSFGLETITNVLIVFFRHDSGYLFRYRSFKIISFLFDKSAFQETKKRIQSVVETRFGNTRAIKIIYKITLMSPLIVIIGIYLSTIFFTVGVRERALVERFGKPVYCNESIGPGLHIKWPWPVDQVKKVKAAYIEELNIGNITDRRSKALLWTRSHGTEEAFLSGDNNLFYPYIVLHYRVKNLFQYLYKNIDPKKLVNEAGHRVATDLFARETFYNIASTERKRLEKDMLTGLQACLDELESGIEMLTVGFKDIHPPISVADSFERVIAGYQEKQKIINDALGYQNNVVPESRGRAAAKQEAARSYITDRQKRAKGKSTRFVMSVPTSKQEKDVAMSRIYLQTMKDVLKDKRKIVIDPRVGMPEIWMDFENVIPQDLTGGEYNEIFPDN